MKASTKIGLAALVAALGGAAAWYVAQPGQVSLPLPKALLKAPEPTAKFRPSLVREVIGDGLADPYGVAVSPKGTIFLADGGDANTISTISPEGARAVLAGGAEGFRDGPAAQAAFNTPSGIALDGKGNLYVADTGNHAIRKITPEGVVTTLAGNGKPGDADGAGAQAQFNGPVGIAVAKDATVFVADTYNDRIRRISPEGVVTTLAGAGKPGFADGQGAAAAFDTPLALAAGPDGVVYVADARNNAIRRIDALGNVTTLAASDDEDRNALLRRPLSLALTHDGHLFIGVGARGRVLQITPQGEIGALPDAGRSADPAAGYDGNVQFYAPRALALAKDGSLLAVDGPARRLLRLTAASAQQPQGVIATGQAAPPSAAAPAPPHRSKPMPWPFMPQDQPREIVGLMGEVRGNYDGDSRDHFHAGLDVQAAVGTPVHVIEDAKVSDPLANWAFGGLGEGINLGAVSYIHMRVGRNSKDKAIDDRFQLLFNEKGKPDRVRVQRGTRFAVGDAIGVVNRMAHVHIDYLERGRTINPLVLPFPGMEDSIAPQVNSITVFDPQGKKLPIKKGQRLHIPRELSEVEVVVDAFDQMDGNLDRRRLGLYKLGYQLLNADGTPVPGDAQPHITQVYDKLPRNREAVKVVYASNSGITVYGSKATHFAYSLHATLRDGEVAPGRWKVAGIAPGDYILRIHAADFAGNVAIKGRDLPLTVD